MSDFVHDLANEPVVKNAPASKNSKGSKGSAAMAKSV